MRIELVDPVHLMKEREHRAELLVVLIVARAGQHGPELVRADEADSRPLLRIIGLVFGRRFLHPADLLREPRRLKDRRARDLSRQDQMLLARNNVQDRLVDAVPAVTALILGIPVIVPRISLPEDRLLRLPVGLHIFHVFLGKSVPDREIQVEEHLRILNDRLVDLDPELREGVARLDRPAVVIVDQVQPVLQELPVPVHAGVLELAVFDHERPDPVKILIHLLRPQAEEVAQDLRVLILP